MTANCTDCVDMPSDSHTTVHKIYYTHTIYTFTSVGHFTHSYTLIQCSRSSYEKDISSLSYFRVTPPRPFLSTNAHRPSHMYTWPLAHGHNDSRVQTSTESQKCVGACTQCACAQRLGVSRAPCGAGEHSHSKPRSQEKVSAPRAMVSSDVLQGRLCAH